MRLSIVVAMSENRVISAAARSLARLRVAFEFRAIDIAQIDHDPASEILRHILTHLS